MKCSITFASNRPITGNEFEANYLWVHANASEDLISNLAVVAHGCPSFWAGTTVIKVVADIEAKELLYVEKG